MSDRAPLSPVYMSRLRLLYNRIEEALGSEDAEAVWRSISWKPDAAQRLLDLWRRHMNGKITQGQWTGLTQAEFTELNQLFDDPAVQAAPGPEGSAWMAKASREASAFFDQLTGRYGEKIARKALEKALARKENRPAKGRRDAAMLEIESYLKSRDESFLKRFLETGCDHGNRKQTSEWLAKVISAELGREVDPKNARRRLELAARNRRKGEAARARSRDPDRTP